MALALTVQTVHHALRTKRLYLIATPSASYVTGGDTVDLTSITTSLGQQDANVGWPGNIKNYEVVSAPAGYTAKLIKGATLATWKLKVFQNAGFTPAGTNSAPAFTGAAMTPVLPIGAGAATDPVGTSGASGTVTLGNGTGACTVNLNAITPTGTVAAPAFTGAAVAAAAQGELPASAYPVGVTGDVFVILLEGPKGQM